MTVGISCHILRQEQGEEIGIIKTWKLRGGYGASNQISQEQTLLMELVLGVYRKVMEPTGPQMKNCTWGYAVKEGWKEPALSLLLFPFSTPYVQRLTKNPLSEENCGWRFPASQNTAQKVISESEMQQLNKQQRN